MSLQKHQWSLMTFQTLFILLTFKSAIFYLHFLQFESKSRLRQEEDRVHMLQSPKPWKYGLGLEQEFLESIIRPYLHDFGLFMDSGACGLSLDPLVLIQINHSRLQHCIMVSISHYKLQILSVWTEQPSNVFFNLLRDSLQIFPTHTTSVITMFLFSSAFFRTSLDQFAVS